MADDLKPAPTGTRRGHALAVSAAGALLVFCAVLPWAGLEAKIGLIGGGVSADVRGIDDAFGVYALVAGLVALACGLAGLLAHPRLAALAVVPGAVAVLAVVMFVTEGSGVQDRISFDLGLLSVAPVIRFGWFAALACSLGVVVLSVLALFRRVRTGPDQS
ncbi:hypothetical protein ETD86_37900 [Nonomuraea turkmeniaca]|uniref:Uncharacterized protein n=1 Tax=Nonomuraea turkmeniaca TaxID=103838 RepID=A0A5S4FNW4_9ACTN|nr:hypothetical protein [Nonomuraea turkmeniaca]TMR10840.1 hypothetical protein ETD86_37900 [Nonomuraea turkmeniaca]